jgi:hypothetical protein
MSTLFFSIDTNNAEGRSMFSVYADAVRLGGSADVELVDGVKSPDYSMYEDRPATRKQPVMQSWPTVTWEVAYSEDEKQLAHDLGRYVACSLGRVRLAIGLKIERYPAVTGQSRGLKKVTCALWEADYAETFATLEESGSELLNCLVRCDEYSDDADDYVVPAATKYLCVSKFNREYIKFVVSEQARYTVSSSL